MTKLHLRSIQRNVFGHFELFVGRHSLAYTFLFWSLMEGSSEDDSAIFITQSQKSFLSFLND